MASEHDTQQRAVLKQSVWNKVWDLVLPAMEQLKEIQGKELVLVLGATCSGKSTLANYLAGVPLEEKTCSMTDRLVIDVAASYEGPALRIGHRGGSTTARPQWIAGDSSSSHRVYCDLPGFGDTRGEAQRIAASILTKIVLSYCQGIAGVVVMFNVYDFNRDGKDFFDRFSCLSRFIASPGQSRGLVHCVVKDRNYLQRRQIWETEKEQDQVYNIPAEVQQQLLINEQEDYQRTLRKKIRAGLKAQERFLIDRMHRLLLSSLEARRSAEGSAMQKVTEQAWACCQQLSCLGRHMFGLDSVFLDENIADKVQSALEDRAQLDLLRLMTGSIWVDYVAVEDATERQKVEELWAARQAGPKDFLVICEQGASHLGAEPTLQWSLRGKTAEGGEACLSVETQQALTELLAQYSELDVKGDDGSAMTDMILAMRELISEAVGYSEPLESSSVHGWLLLPEDEEKNSQLRRQLEASWHEPSLTVSETCLSGGIFSKEEGELNQAVACELAGLQAAILELFRVSEEIGYIESKEEKRYHRGRDKVLLSELYRELHRYRNQLLQHHWLVKGLQRLERVPAIQRFWLSQLDVSQTGLSVESGYLSSVDGLLSSLAALGEKRPMPRDEVLQACVLGSLYREGIEAGHEEALSASYGRRYRAYESYWCSERSIRYQLRRACEERSRRQAEAARVQATQKSDRESEEHSDSLPLHEWGSEVKPAQGFSMRRFALGVCVVLGLVLLGLGGLSLGFLMGWTLPTVLGVSLSGYSLGLGLLLTGGALMILGGVGLTLQLFDKRSGTQTSTGLYRVGFSNEMKHSEFDIDEKGKVHQHGSVFGSSGSRNLEGIPRISRQGGSSSTTDNSVRASLSTESRPISTEFGCS